MSRKGAAVQQPELPMKDITPKRAAGTIKPGDTITDAKTGKTGKVLSVASSPKARKKKGTAVAVAQPQAPKEEERSLAKLLMQAASDKEVDAAKARAMFDLYKDVQAHDAMTAFTKAFIKLRHELPTIGRDGKIDHGQGKQKNLYASYPNIIETVDPLLKKYGFALASWIEPAGADNKINIVSQLDHEAGHFRRSTFPLGPELSGSKNPIQAWGSTESYGMRYNAIALLNIISRAPSDRDTDGHPNKSTLKPAKGGGLVDVEEKPKVTEDQAIKLRELIEWCGVGTKKFNDHYGIAKVSDLPADLFAAASKSCEDFHASQQRKNG